MKQAHDFTNAPYSRIALHSAQVDYIISGPVVCMVWEGLNVIKVGRDMIGGSEHTCRVLHVC